jgi:ArsR family transcriptional regulator, arsenate/arsenite/antimonite-responsive transcriptional repressor
MNEYVPNPDENTPIIDPKYAANATILRAMGHPLRLQLLELIFDMELPVRALEDQLELPQAIISTQLSVLRHTGLVQVRRLGTSRQYRIDDKRILEVMKLLNPKLSQDWP